MNIVFFDSGVINNLLPFTYTRPMADIRCGIFTMAERWKFLAQKAGITLSTSYLTAPHLAPVYPANLTGESYLIYAPVFGTAALFKKIQAMGKGDSIEAENGFVAYHSVGDSRGPGTVHEVKDVLALKHPWDIFSMNDMALRRDYELITEGRESEPIPEGVTVTGAEYLFIEPGATIYPGVVINAKSGPVYIGKDVEIMEGALIRGPFAALDHSVVKMGAKIYGATTLGPGCKVGGELNNVVFFANSNKAHDGYLGNAVIGEWCNLGADTNCSNLKNNYDEVKVWSEQQGKMVGTGLTFCGLMMGDHSKCGINTMFNTGTVVGVSCNIFGGGFPDKHIPSFSWGSPGGLTEYKLDKAMETANRMMGRRGKQLTDKELTMFEFIFNNRKAK